MNNLINCIVRTKKGLIVECYLTQKTITELKKELFVSVRKKRG